jgi:WD40 repeat protein/serine/threonine protein kinase
LSPERERQLRTLFEAAIELDTAAWDGFVKRECAGDEEMSTELALLLAAHAKPGGLIPLSPTLTEPICDEQEPDRLIGTQVGNYHIIREIGRGGMGMVYLAEQLHPITRQVALKVIKLGMDTRQIIARFETERQALALMDHPNIAKVLDAGATPEGKPYFVMEFIPGAPITEYCDNNRMSNRQRLELFAQVCQALQHAHQKGIIHRDIKPSNVLVWLQDGKPVPKVIDFGTAKAVDRGLTERTAFTELGVLIGTPEYMSPEQAQMTGQDVDTTTDIYSLGVLLYELLGGALPFDSKSLRRGAYDEIRRLIREEEPPRPSERFSSLGAEAAEVAEHRHTDVAGLARELRGDLDWITMTAMAKERNRRYASASELAADIARHLRDEPVLARPPSVSYRLGKLIKKNRWAVLAVTAVFVSLLLGLAASTALYFRAERQRLEAQAARVEAERQSAEAEKQRAAAEQERAEARRQGAQAESQRILAEQSRMTADQQRREAELQHAEAERQRSVAEQRSIEARRRGDEALEQRSAAEKEREIAEQQSQAADAQRRAAERQRLLAQTQSYAANLTAADLHIRSNEIAEARRRLFLCPPALRGWEWRYLLWKCDTSLATLTGRSTPADGSRPVLGFSKDGARIFWASSDALDWWSTSNYKPLAERRDLALVLGVDRDGGRIVSASSPRGGYPLRVFDASSGANPNKVLATLAGNDAATCAAFGRNATRVVSGNTDGSIQMWDVASGRPLATLYGHSGVVSAVAFSSDGERIVSAGDDRTVRVWDAGTGRAMYAIAGHGGPVLSIDFSPDRRTIVSGSADKTARIWDAATGQALHTLTGHECGVQGVAISPDGSMIASASCTTLRLWDATSGKLAATLGAEWRSGIAAVSFSPDGARIAAASATGEIKMWNALTYGGGILRRAGPEVDRIAISPGGGQLALHNAKTQSLEVWDTRQRNSTWTAHGMDAQVTALAFSPDSNRLATGSTDNAVRIWNAATGRLMTGPVRLPAPITSLAFTTDGAWLISGSSDRAVSAWDTTSLQRVFGVTSPGAVHVAIPSPDGKRVAIGNGDGTVVVFDAVKNGVPLKLTLPPGSRTVLSLAYSPDGRRIASGTEDSGDIGVWDAGSGLLLSMLKGHSASVDALTFSPDGSRIVSGSRDKTIRIWDAATYDPLLVMGDHEEPIAALAFSPDGARIYSASPDGTVRVWETRTTAGDSN